LQTNIVEKIKTHILCSTKLFENPSVFKIMWKKYFRAEEDTDDNMAYAHLTLDT